MIIAVVIIIIIIIMKIAILLIIILKRFAPIARSTDAISLETDAFSGKQIRDK